MQGAVRRTGDAGGHGLRGLLFRLVLLLDAHELIPHAVDHWVAFGLLVLVGGNMIKESLDKSEETSTPDLSFKAMLPLAVATSIDALAVGISLAMTAEVSIWTGVGLIGATTFILSAVGVTIGGIFGNKFEKKAEFLGGAVLILLGCKILLESLGIL